MYQFKILTFKGPSLFHEAVSMENAIQEHSDQGWEVKDSLHLLLLPMAAMCLSNSYGDTLWRRRA